MSDAAVYRLHQLLLIVGMGHWALGTCTEFRLRSTTAKSLAQPLVEKYWAWDMGHGTWGIGHGALGIGY